MTKLFRMIFAVLAVALLLSLAGCAAGPRMVDSDVQTFVTGPAPVSPALYRFERLPSQNNAAAQDQIEALARVALAKVGLTPAPLVSGAVSGTAAAAPAARYAVQVGVQISVIDSPYEHAPPGVLWGHRADRRWGSGFGLLLEPSWRRHAVHILLRDSASGQLVYESDASFDGPWVDSANLLPAILDAALQGYPNPPAGLRKVVIELPGAQAED